MYRSLENKIRDMFEGKTGAISVSKDRDTMEHDPNDQVTVGTYKSKHFEISPEAQKLFSQGIPKNSNAIDAEHLAIHHDKLFALVKGAMVKKQVSDTDLENAKDHMSKIQYLATKLGLEGEINYLQPHVEKLFKHAGTEGNPFTSKPTEYTQEPRDFDVDNTKQFITRAAKAERKVKVIDDEFNPEETEMVADKNLGANPAVVEAAKKVMEKLDPVGKEDKDVNNDGKVDSSDNYLKKRRNAISSAMRAARQKEVQKKVDAESKKQWKKSPQAGTLSAMKKEEVEQIDEIGNTEKGVDRLKKYVASDRSKVKIKDVLDAKRSADPDKAIEKLGKRQGYKSKALKKIRAFDAAKNPKPKEEPTPLHRMVYPSDMKYHGDSYEPTGDQALDERNMENKTKKDNVTRQIGAHAYIQGVKKSMSPSPKITGREVMKDPKLGSKKVADIYRKLPNPMKKEEVEQVDEGRRGRPPKDPVARAKFYAAVMDEPDQHIMMQLKKAADSEKAYHVTFKNGQKHPVEPEHAKKVMGKYMGMKPDEKKVFQKKVAKSHEHFMKAATEVEKPVAKKPLDQKQRMAAIAKAAMKNRNKGRDKSFGDTAD